MHAINCTCCPNPVIRETALRAYPGWTVREYKNGMFDATNGRGLTLGERSFTAVVAHVRADSDRKDWAATQRLVADMEAEGLL